MTARLGVNLALLLFACSEAVDQPPAAEADLPSRADHELATPVAPAVGPILAVGRTHACLLRSADELFCWGDDTVGELGMGARTGDAVRVTGLAPLVDVAAGAGVTCVCERSGRTLCWGFRGYDRVEDEDLREPRVIPVPSCQNVVASAKYACSLDREGAVRCWGQTSPLSEPGDAVIGSREAHGWYEEPVRIDGLPPIRSIAAAGNFAVAIGHDGQVYAWGGRDRYGQLSDGARRGSIRVVPIEGARQASAAGGMACVLVDRSSVVCWGEDPAVRCDPYADACRTPELRHHWFDQEVREVAVSLRRACVRLADGQMLCWGRSWSAAIGIPSQPEPLRTLAEDVDLIGFATDHGCLLLAGVPHCWGPPSDWPVNEPPGASISL